MFIHIIPVIGASLLGAPLGLYMRSFPKSYPQMLTNHGIQINYYLRLVYAPASSMTYKGIHMSNLSENKTNLPNFAGKMFVYFPSKQGISSPAVSECFCGSSLALSSGKMGGSGGGLKASRCRTHGRTPRGWRLGGDWVC